VVKRDSQTVTHEDILGEVRAALEAEGAPKNAELQTASGSLAVSLPVEATPSIQVGKIAFDPRSSRFSAIVDISATEGDRVVFTRQVAVGGRMYATEALPVLSATLNRGDIIGANDVTVALVRADQVRDGAVTDPYALVGKQARRPIKEGEPILASQLQAPVLVNRGDEVVIFYALKTMNLTAKGKAMDAGGQGDIIRILNTSSNRTLMAKVVQPHQVVVDAVNLTAMR
jgi:flagella basal body P-ring formation protein FlgA